MSVGELLRISRAWEGGWSAERVAQSFHRLKGLGRGQRGLSGRDGASLKELLRVLEGQALQNLGGMGGRHVNMIVGAYAALPGTRPGKELFEGLERQALDCMREARQVSCFLWGCAKLEMRPSDSFLGLVGAAARAFNPQDVANVMWACATLEMWPSGELFGKLCLRAERVMEGFLPQGIANVMWACATLEMRPSGELFGKLCSRAEAVVEGFKPQEIANLMWACATLEMRPPGELFGKLCSMVEAVVEGFIPQEIANLMWACAKLEMQPSGELFGKLCLRVEAVVEGFIPQNIANLMWACAKLEMRPPVELFGKLCSRAENVVEDFIPQNVANLMLACAKLEMQPPGELFGKLCSRAENVVEGFNPQNIANVMLACATLEMRPPGELFGKLCSRAEGLVEGFKPQEVCNFVWSCAVLSRVREGVGWLSVHREILGADSVSFEGWSIEHLCQMHQFLVSCDLETRDAQLSPGERELLQGIKAANARLCLEAFASQQVSPSRLQRDVARAVGACGASFQEEAVDAVSGYSIDILVEDGGKGVAIEVDGPSHFLGGGRALKGSTVLKRRHLEQLGYRAVSVPYWEWGSLRGKGEQEAYVRGLLGA